MCIVIVSKIDIDGAVMAKTMTDATATVSVVASWILLH
jgi:hypothetical protein